MAELCHEGVDRDGEYGPCNKPAVGYAVGDYELYPACLEHAWLKVVEGTEIGECVIGSPLYELTERGMNNRGMNNG